LGSKIPQGRDWMMDVETVWRFVESLDCYYDARILRLFDGLMLGLNVGTLDANLLGFVLGKILGIVEGSKPGSLDGDLLG
jgi:hypothetical protein